jgi:hypothetical protein
MKWIFTLLAIHLSVLTQAQVAGYLDGNPVWRQSRIFNYSCFEIHDYMYYLNGDTTLGNYTYKKVYDRHYVVIDSLFSPPYVCSGEYYYDEFRILIRQEGKKLFVNEQGTEFLLYDFDLEVGDTLPETYNHYNHDVIVSSIDSLQVGEEYRKVFHLENTFFGFGLLIEGIGFNTGLLDYFDDWEFPSGLDCFTQYDTTWYPEMGVSCDLTVNTQPNEPAPTCKVFPNPVTNRLFIDIDPLLEFEYMVLTNAYGVRFKLLPEKLQNGRYVLDVSDFVPGIYFLQIQSDKAGNIARKLVKQ